MIKHIVDVKEKKRVHTKAISLTQKDFDRINRLLSYEDLESMSDEEKEKLECKQDSSEYVFGVEFDDGSSLDWWLCSGTNNYYDNVIFSQMFSDNFINLDCVFELDDIEVEAGNDIYRVVIMKSE